MHFLFRRLRFLFGQRHSLASMEICLYTRPGCHLCDAVGEQLERQQKRFGYRLAVVDISTDSERTRQYGDEAPVVVVDGKVRFRGGVNPVLLQRLLRAEALRGKNKPRRDADHIEQGPDHL